MRSGRPVRVALVGCAIACTAACSNVLGLPGLVADRDPTADGGGENEAGPTGGCASTCGTPGCGSCPTSTTARVAVTSGGTHYSIDAHEVSTAEYRAWLATKPVVASQPGLCAWNDSFEPGIISPRALAWIKGAGLSPAPECDGWLAKQATLGDDNVPIVCVDYCDAVAYCTWAKGHLCGRVGGGGSNTFTSDQAPARGEWWNACSSGGATVYPYGNAYVKGVCNDEGHGARDVGSFPECQGGVPRLFDMSGNVSELDDTCSEYGNPPEGEDCLWRGGADFNDGPKLTCVAFRQGSRGMQDSSTGFRCCGP